MITLFSIRPKAFNVGNDAIFKGLQFLIREAFGHVVNVIQLPATSRYESQAYAGLTAKTIHDMNQYGHGVIVGGGNLYENGELEVNLNALRTLETPLMLFSMSAGRIYNRRYELARRTDAMPDNIVKALNDRADFSLPRDIATLEYLKSLGVSHATLGGCPTVFLDRMMSPDHDLPEADRGVAWVTVRTPELMNIPLDIKARVRTDVEGIVQLLREQGYKDVRLLCHDHRDIPFAASFRGMQYVFTADVDLYLRLLRECAISVTYRLHAALPCLSFGKPFIKLSYDERALSLMDTLGLSAWNIDIVKTPDTVGAVRDRFANLSQLSEIIEGARPTLDGLQSTMVSNFAAFADRVQKYAAL